jgi:hypothetical protein
MYKAFFEKFKSEGLSNRAGLWLIFAGKVAEHIESYTVPQYGDYPTDQLTTMPDAVILANIQRYCNRALSNSRGPEESIRDMLKIAHYASELWQRLVGEEEDSGDDQD